MFQKASRIKQVTLSSKVREAGSLPRRIYENLQDEWMKCLNFRIFQDFSGFFRTLRRHRHPDSKTVPNYNVRASVSFSSWPENHNKTISKQNLFVSLPLSSLRISKTFNATKYWFPYLHFLIELRWWNFSWLLSFWRSINFIILQALNI